MKILLISSLLFGLFHLSLLADEQEGKELFEQKCASCHMIYKPADKSSLKAPPLQMMVWRLSQVFDDSDEFEAYINDFVLNPTEEKALCPAVEWFGLMPSMEGNITKEELAIIAEWIVENF